MKLILLRNTVHCHEVWCQNGAGTTVARGEFRTDTYPTKAYGAATGMWCSQAVTQYQLLHPTPREMSIIYHFTQCEAKDTLQRIHSESL
jgi:hypothetical protein